MSNYEWHGKVLRTKTRAIKANEHNLVLFLENHPKWKGRFGWDEQRDLPTIDGEPLDDTHVLDALMWFQRCEIATGKAKVWQCMRYVARQHPVEVPIG